MSDIILINGSVNPNSRTKRLLSILSKHLQHHGYKTKLINVGELNLPLFDPTLNPPAPIEDLWYDLVNSKALIFGSPEYHGGYSGALKNFIDYLNGEVFFKKPLGLVVSTGGLKSGVNTLNSLRIVFRSLYANVLPEQVSISEEEYVNERLETKNITRLLSISNGIHTYLKMVNRESKVNS